MPGGYEQAFLARAAAEEMAAPPPPPPLLTHKVHSRRAEQHQQQHPSSAPSSSSRHQPQRLLEASEWSKLARFHVSTHQQALASRRHAEVSLSSALRCHPTALEGSKLSLASSSVTHLDRLPVGVAARVKTLYLSSNSVASIDNVDQFAQLTTLSAASNCLRYLQELRPLASLEHLEKLSLEGNIVASMPYYREHVLGLCPRLASLDNKAVSGAERTQARAEYQRTRAELEELRCNELRLAALVHLLCLLKCRAELAASSSSSRGGAGVAQVQSFVATTLPDLPTLLRVLSSGGVYRWAQIGCADHFDRVVQDLALRAHLHAQRKASQAQRTQLSRRTGALAEHWAALTAECAAYQRQQLLRLMQVCEGHCGQAPALTSRQGQWQGMGMGMGQDGDAEGSEGGEAALLAALGVLVFDAGATASELRRVYGGEDVAAPPALSAVSAAPSFRAVGAGPAASAPMPAPVPLRVAASASAPARAPVSTLPSAAAASAAASSSGWGVPAVTGPAQEALVRRSLDADKRAAPPGAVETTRGRGDRVWGDVAGEMRGKRREEELMMRKSSTELLGEQRAAAQAQYQSLLRAMGTGAGMGAKPPAAVGAGGRGAAQLGSLSSLLPPQQEEPEAAVPSPGRGKRAAAVPVSVHVAASAYKAKTAGPSGRRPSPTRTAPSSSSSASSAALASSSGAAAGAKARNERGAKSAGQVGVASSSGASLAGAAAAAAAAASREPQAFDFSSERFRALMARAGEPESVEAAGLLAALEVLWRRPLPEMDVRGGGAAGAEASAEVSAEAVLGPEPRAPYQRPEAAGSINELKAQIQTTLNDLSQYQREEYLTWVASESLKRHVSATHRAVVDVSDAALGRLAALARVTATCHEDVAQAGDWAQLLAPALERAREEAEKIDAVRDAMAAARRRREAALAAGRGEEAKRADILRSTQEVDEATAVMVAEIEANPHLARLVRSELARSSALDLSERCDSVLRKVLRGWRVRVRRQRKIKKFAAAQARRVDGRCCVPVFAHWARVTRVARVSARIQASLLRKAALSFLARWRRAAQMARKVLRLSRRRLRAPCRAALRHWAAVCADGRSERQHCRELEAVAVCFVKIRVFRGWQRHAAACRVDPHVERANTATALRFLLRSRFSAWAALASAQAIRGREYAIVASVHCARAVLLRSWREWRLHLRCGRFARLCGGRRGILGLARHCAARRTRRRQSRSVRHRRVCVLARTCLRYWQDLCARRRHVPGAARLVEARWTRCLVRTKWRSWTRLCQEARHQRLRDQAAMRFYLSLLLRRHFVAWRALFPAGQAALEQAAAEALARDRAAEVLADDEQSVAASSVLIQTLHAHISLVEAAPAKAARFFRGSSTRRALARLHGSARRRRRLRRLAALLWARRELQARRGVFSAWQGLWLRGMQARLQLTIETAEVTRAEAEVAALRAMVARLQEDHDGAQSRAEHLGIGCEEREAQLADTTLALREVQLVLDARTREADELRASLGKMEAECRAILAAKRALDDLRSGYGLPSDETSDADSEALVEERERAVREQQSQLACQEEAYTRAVLLQSQAQLRQDQLAAEAKAAAAMQKFHKKEAASLDAALQDLAHKRVHAERALALCASSLQECVERAAGLEENQEGSEQRLADEQADLESRVAAAEEEEEALSRELEDLRRVRGGRAARAAAARRESVAQLDSIDLLGVSQATLRFAEEDVKTSSAAALLGLGVDFEGKREEGGRWGEKENVRANTNKRLKPLRGGAGRGGVKDKAKTVPVSAAPTNEAVIARRIRARAAGKL